MSRCALARSHAGRSRTPLTPEPVRSQPLIGDAEASQELDRHKLASVELPNKVRAAPFFVFPGCARPFFEFLRACCMGHASFSAFLPALPCSAQVTAACSLCAGSDSRVVVGLASGHLSTVILEDG